MATWKKVVTESSSGNISQNAATVTNGVYNTGNQTIAGTKTFSSTITGSVSGNAATVTTNQNLTGHVTSVGNAAVLGSFTKAQLSTATSDGTPLYSGDVTSNATHTGDVTGSGALSIATGAVDLAHMSSEAVDEDNLYVSNAGSNGQFLSKQSGNNGGLTWATPATTSPNNGTLTMATTAPLSGDDTFTADQSGNTTFTVAIASAAVGTVGAVGLSSAIDSTSAVLAATPAAVKTAYDLANGKVSCDETNVKSVLAALDSSDTLNIGDSGNDATINIRGNLNVAGSTTAINTTELTINDNKIILNKDAVSGEDAGIIIEQGNTGDDIELGWSQAKGNFIIDSQGVNSSSTTVGLICTTIKKSNNTAPTADGDGHGVGSFVILSNDTIYMKTA